MSQHTPGPWAATRCGIDAYAIHTDHKDACKVAEINGPYTPSFDRCAEDATLIAAAPEMLLALRKVLEASAVSDKALRSVVALDVINVVRKATTVSVPLSDW
jgi:hypothetical protein